MKRRLLFITALICAVQVFSQTTYTVSSAGTNSGTSWTTIKAAIAAAASGDIIEVAAETFTEKNINFPSSTPKSITIKGAGIDQTIVQAYATPFNTPASNSSVFNLDGVYSSAITITIQDMTIQNGYSTSNGGGIRITKTGTIAPTLNLANLNIANNNSAGGGGVYISGEVILTIESCNITGNTMTGSGGNGGGIYILPGTVNPVNATIKNSTISFNTSVSHGGGIMVLCGPNASTPVAHSLTLENTTIYKNSCTVAAKFGGGMDFRMAGSGQTLIPTQTVTLNHCTVVGNTTNGAAGADGVCFENGAYQVTLVMNNSIVMGNSGSTTNMSQVGIGAVSQAKLTNGGVTNSIFGIVSGGTWVTDASNKLDAVIDDLAFPTLDNFALSADATPVLLIGSSSIAKDFVTANALSIATDQLGNQRDATPDAGAYEYYARLAIEATAGTGGTVTSGAGNYIAGATATLVATANSGYRFVNWTENGTVVSTNTSYSFTVSTARTLVANFVKTFVITVLKNNSGQFNTVTGAGTYDVNATVTLVAVPKAGYHFDNWTDANGLVSSNLSYQFTATANYTITANFTADSGTLANMFYSYTAGTSDYFYVYEKVNDNGVYRQFKIAHIVSAPINCNLWRIMDSYFVQYNGSTMTQFQQILTGGENELAFKTNRAGVVEFTGGFHGDERIDLDPSSYVRFYADGSLVPLNSSIPLTACTSFYYQQYSSVHQTGTGPKTAPYTDYFPVSGNPIDSYHTKKTVFENNGFTTYNSFKWLNVVPINTFYYGIFCVNKDITTQGTNDYGTTEAFDQSSVNRLNSDKQKIVMVNATMGTTVTCNSFINLFPYTPTLSAYILDNNVYHKYYSSLGKPTFQIGDSCSFTATISFDYLPTTTNVPKVSSSNRVKITSMNGLLQVDGLLPNEKFCTFNISGILVNEGGYENNSVSLESNQLYIVRLELNEGIKTLKIKA